MTKRTAYTWTTEDPSRDFVVEAFNRLRNFWRENDPADIELMKPFRRCVLNTADFYASDPSDTANLLHTLAKRAEEAAGDDGRMGYAANAEAIRQAAQNAHDAATLFLEMFYGAANEATEGRN